MKTKHLRDFEDLLIGKLEFDYSQDISDNSYFFLPSDLTSLVRADPGDEYAEIIVVIHKNPTVLELVQQVKRILENELFYENNKQFIDGFLYKYD